MKTGVTAVRERLLDSPCGAEPLFGLAREKLARSVWFDGRGEFGRGWSCGTMFAVEGRQWTSVGPPDRWLKQIDRRVLERRRRGGTGRTGIVVLLPYEALDSPDPLRTATADPAPGSVLVIEVDASVAALDNGQLLLTDRGGQAEPHRLEHEPLRTIDDWCRDEQARRVPPASARGPATTSLPRERYLQAVQRLKRHIADGDVYQANLCQRIEVPFDGDPWGTYRTLAGRTPAPRSAYIETKEFVLASVSPELFLRVEPPDGIETWPIKGTRARCEDPGRDRAAARALLASEKDRAELLMIVDLERNDLGRICRTGTVQVRDPYELQSFPAVHHLMARVAGRLRAGLRPSDILRATFPGGSITGAPKIRARKLLNDVEPVRRGFFTGSLLWFGDDGTLDSSILIRTVVFSAGTAWIGAGGGIVADSEPEAEWQESNLKARAATQVLGFDPKETT